MRKTKVILTLAIVLLILLLPTITCSKENSLVPTDSVDIITQYKSHVNWQADCGEFLFADLSNERRFFAYSIDKNLHILQVVCDAGAYQAGQIFYKINNSTVPTIRLLTFKQYINNEIAASNNLPPFVTIKDTYIWGLINFDKSNNTLTAENRFRSGGGCGTYTVFNLDSSSPKIVEFRAKLECTLSQSPPSLWKLYPSDVQDKWPNGKNPLRTTK